MLEHVADRLEIEQLIARYVHAIDKSDYVALDDVFTPVTTFDFSAIGGICDTWPVVREWWASRHDVYVRYLHLMVNSVVDFRSDDEATACSKVFNPCGILGPEGELHEYIVVGRWDDVLSRTEVGWRITQRMWLHDWISGDYPLEELPGAVAAPSNGAPRQNAT